MKLNPIQKKVNYILQQELKYLSGLYPYDLKKFFDARLIHCINIFAFLKDASNLSQEFIERLINLASGIELLSIGASHHNFNTRDFIKLAKVINGGNPDGKPTGKEPDRKLEKTISKNERDYTVDLLFGDIFYSRAVIYLLKYGDHYIFESILDSLKSVHKNRLLLHQRLTEVSDNIKDIKEGKKEVDFETGIRDLLEDNIVAVLGANSLYKTSLMIGWGLFAGMDGNYRQLHFPYEAINDFMLSKALNDLSGFFKALPGEYFFLKDIKYMAEKKVQIRDRIVKIISGFKQDWLKSNFKSLEKLYL